MNRRAVASDLTSTTPLCGDYNISTANQLARRVVHDPEPQHDRSEIAAVPLQSQKPLAGQLGERIHYQPRGVRRSLHLHLLVADLAVHPLARSE
jgi:hypothetical protein